MEELKGCVRGAHDSLWFKRPAEKGWEKKGGNKEWQREIDLNQAARH